MQTENVQVKPGLLSRIIQMANPVFVILAVLVPVGALVYSINSGSLVSLNYVHVLIGGLWTGIDLFMGFVLGPVMSGLEPVEKAAVFKRLIPRMTFLMPVLAGVTSTAGFMLAGRLGYPLSSPKILAAIGITAILTVQGFGFLLPNEIRIFKQILSEKPDIDKIARLGMLNAKLGGMQGVFQLAIIFVMATIRL